MTRGVPVTGYQEHEIVMGIKARKTSKRVGRDVDLHHTTVNKHFRRSTGQSVKWYHMKRNSRARMTSHQSMRESRKRWNKMRHMSSSSRFQGGRMVYSFGRGAMRVLSAGMGRRR